MKNSRKKLNKLGLLKDAFLTPPQMLSREEMIAIGLKVCCVEFNVDLNTVVELLRRKENE